MTGRVSQRGSATVWTLVACVLLGLAATGGAVGGAVLVAHREAGAAADLAALAGAAALQEGREGCAAAGTVAVANDARLVSCAVAGAEVRVVVRSGVEALGHLLDVDARARAGPAPAPASTPDRPAGRGTSGGRDAPVPTV